MKFIICVFIFISITSANLSAQNFQWRLLSASPGISGTDRFEDMFFINSSTGWIVNFDGKMYKTTTGGNNWNNIFTSTFGGLFRSVGFFNGNVGLIGTLINDTNKILYRTTNGGLNWTAVTNITGGTRPQGICGMSIVDSNTAYACGRYYGSARIIKTTDMGMSWKKVFDDASKAQTLIDCYFWTRDSGIAVGGSLPMLDGNAVIIKTTDGGNTWQRVHSTTRLSEWCWKISFISRNIGFVSIEREQGMAYILKTTNNGDNWSEIPFRVYDEEGIGFVNENTGWVGGWGGPTYQTTNGGANWQLAGWGTNVNRFRFLSDSLAYAVGDRVYKYSSGLVGVNSVSNEIPSAFYLHQNYPNPFNPSTNLEFGISELGFVTLKVYDVLGNEFAALVNEKKNPGNYRVEFDGSYLSSGIYFYELSAGEYSEVKRMILLK